MNNVLEGSLFVNPNKKFDEIQSIIRPSFEKVVDSLYIRDYVDVYGW